MPATTRPKGAKARHTVETEALETHPMPSLPVTILQQIFSVLEGHQSYIRPLTLVSKLFYDIASPLLYKIIRITSHDQGMRLLDGLSSHVAVLAASGRRYRHGRTVNDIAVFAARLQGFASTTRIDFTCSPTPALCARIRICAKTLGRSHLFPRVRTVSLALFHLHFDRARYCIDRSQLSGLEDLAHPSAIDIDLKGFPRQSLDDPKCRCAQLVLCELLREWTDVNSIRVHGGVLDYYGKECLAGHTVPNDRSIALIVEMYQASNERETQYSDLGYELWHYFLSCWLYGGPMRAHVRFRISHALNETAISQPFRLEHDLFHNRTLSDALKNALADCGVVMFESL